MTASSRNHDLAASRAEPVMVEITVEAEPATEQVEFSRAEWDAMTPRQRSDALQDAVDTAIANAGGAGWHILSGATDDEVA